MYLKEIKISNIENTVNPQKVVRLYFPTLVFLVRLSFEAVCKVLRLEEIFYPKQKILIQGFQKWLKIENCSFWYPPRANKEPAEIRCDYLSRVKFL